MPRYEVELWITCCPGATVIVQAADDLEAEAEAYAMAETAHWDEVDIPEWIERYEVVGMLVVRDRDIREVSHAGLSSTPGTARRETWSPPILPKPTSSDDETRGIQKRKKNFEVYMIIIWGPRTTVFIEAATSEEAVRQAEAMAATFEWPKYDYVQAIDESGIMVERITEV